MSFIQGVHAIAGRVLRGGHWTGRPCQHGGGRIQVSLHCEMFHQNYQNLFKSPPKEHHLVPVCFHESYVSSRKSTQGRAEPKLRLARSEAAVQEKSTLLSANQPEVQEPGRLSGQHGQQTGQRTAGEDKNSIDRYKKRLHIGPKHCWRVLIFLFHACRRIFPLKRSRREKRTTTIMETISSKTATTVSFIALFNMIPFFV